jgi:hypothetical protein
LLLKRKRTLEQRILNTQYYIKGTSCVFGIRQIRVKILSSSVTYFGNDSRFIDLQFNLDISNKIQTTHGVFVKMNQINASKMLSTMSGI